MSFHKLLERRDCGLALVLGESPKKRVGPDQHVPGTEVLARAVLRTNAFGLQQLRLNRGHDLPGDLVLQRKNVDQVAIVAFGPEMLTGFGVDQLGSDAHAAAALADAPFQHVAHPEFSPDLTYVRSLALVDK